MRLLYNLYLEDGWIYGRLLGHSLAFIPLSNYIVVNYDPPGRCEVVELYLRKFIVELIDKGYLVLWEDKYIIQTVLLSNFLVSLPTAASRPNFKPLNNWVK